MLQIKDVGCLNLSLESKLLSKRRGKDRSIEYEH